MRVLLGCEEADVIKIIDLDVLTGICGNFINQFGDRYYEVHKTNYCKTS